MANTLTNLIPDIMVALDVVSREKIGFISAVSVDSQVARAAINQTVRSPVAPAVATAANTPGVNAPDTGDQVIGNVDLAITYSQHVPVRWNGEETLGLRNAGTFQNIQQQRFAQAFRTLANEIEALIAATYVGASRAYGTAGTAPFGTANDFSGMAGVAQILDDNGAPDGDRQLVIGSPAMFNVRAKQASLFKVNEAGSADILRTGMFALPLQGFAMRYSGQVKAHTKGAGTDYDADLTAGYAIGATTIHLDGGTANTTGIKAGDVVTFASDTANKYVVTTGTGDNAEADIVLGAPGLRATLADTIEATVGNSYAANMAFARSAIVLATRLPALPEGGDSAADVVQVVDPVSGLVYEIAHYKQFLQNVYHVRIAAGVKMVKPEHCALLLG